MSKPKRQFDFTKFKQRHIALKILYFGWNYDGLAEQSNNDNTIEYHLFNALTKTCLVESRSKCKYNRCGRTDKGVSSYGQVVNLAIRSNLVDEDNPHSVGLFTPELYSGDSLNDDKSHNNKPIEEINYIDTLNRVLPDHIRAIAWAPVKKEFSSRFNCQSRSYSYIIPRGDLCLKSMEEALQYLVGEHDFRNLCSFDLKNGVTNHCRTILATSLRPISSISDNSTTNTVSCSNKYSFIEFVIVGQAFLYHQIRCIMTVILLIGSKREPPELVRDLLDVSKCPARPNYNRASPMPLSLFDCQYNPDDMPVGWIYNHQAICNIYRQLKQLWLQYRTKSMMIERVLLDLESTIESNEIESSSQTNMSFWKDFGLECDNMSDTKYIPLLKRPRDETLESKLEAMNKKKKVQQDDEGPILV